MKQFVSFAVLIGIVLLFGFLSFEVLSGFMLPLFLALLLVVMFRPMHTRLARRLHNNHVLAAGITTSFVSLIILLPLIWVLTRAATDAVALLSEFNPDSFVQQAGTLRRELDLDLPPDGVQQAVTALEVVLYRLREGASPGTLAAAMDDDERRRLIERVAEKHQRLQLELWPNDDPTSNVPSITSTAGNRRLREAFERLSLHVGELPERFDKRSELLTAVQLAEAALERVKEPLFGGPLRGWLKQMVTFDRSQVDELRRNVQRWAGPLAVGLPQLVGGFVLQFMIGLSVMIVSLYYFLADGPAMIDQVMKLTPLESRYEIQLLNQFGTLTRAILIAMLLSAAVQGVLAGLGYLLVGFESVFLLSLLTMVLAIVPFIGAIPVWGSCALWLFLHDGRPQAAGALAIYGVVLGILGDNVIKPWVLHGRSNLHPLLGLLSVLGGAQALGPVGIVVGPMVVAILQTLLVMLRTELSTLDSTRAAAAELTPPREPSGSGGEV